MFTYACVYPCVCVCVCVGGWVWFAPITKYYVFSHVFQNLPPSYSRVYDDWYFIYGISISILKKELARILVIVNSLVYDVEYVNLLWLYFADGAESSLLSQDMKI